MARSGVRAAIPAARSLLTLSTLGRGRDRGGGDGTPPRHTETTRGQLEAKAISARSGSALNSTVLHKGGPAPDDRAVRMSPFSHQHRSNAVCVGILLSPCGNRRGAEEDESPWVQQGDLQVQLGGNIYGNVGREALDRAIVQHAGGMVLWHPQKSALAEAEQDEQMRRALALEQRISALNMNAS